MKALAVLAGASGLALLFSGCTATMPGTSASKGLVARWLLRQGLTARESARLLVLSAVIGVGAVALGIAATGSIALALVATVAVAPTPVVRARAARRRRREEMSEAWPDAISSIIAGVRAGMSLPECCCALAERGPEALRHGFAGFASTYRACMSFEAALDRLSTLLEDPIADRVTIVLRLANEVGGTDLVRVLRATSDFIREDLRTRGEVRARWSWTLNAARLAAGSPFAVLFVMALRPEARLAYNTSAGMTTIVIGSLVTLVGYRLMLRAARLPEERRLG